MRIVKQSIAKCSENAVSVDNETDNGPDASKTHNELLAKGIQHTSGAHAVQGVAGSPHTTVERVASEQTQQVLQLCHTERKGVNTTN